MLIRVCGMIRTYIQLYCTDNYLKHSSIIWPIQLNSLVFVYKWSGRGFESSRNHLNFRFPTCFELKCPWHSGNYGVWILSEGRTWLEKTYTQMSGTDKCSQHSSIIWPIWLNGQALDGKLSGWWFQCSCSRLRFRFWARISLTLRQL